MNKPRKLMSIRHNKFGQRTLTIPKHLGKHFDPEKQMAKITWNEERGILECKPVTMEN